MTRLVLRTGGALHPGLVMVERNGDMTVRCRDAGASGAVPLFTVPRELLIPLDGSVWADSTERLEMLTPPTGLTGLQRDALDLHIALYNATGKVPWANGAHPQVALSGEDGVIASVGELRPDFRTFSGVEVQEATDTSTDGHNDEFAAASASSPDKTWRRGSPGHCSAAGRWDCQR